MMTEQQPLPAETPDLPAPPFALHACTTSELSRYREELEREISAHLPTAAVVNTLRRLLDDVLLEQDERRRIRANVS